MPLRLTLLWPPAGVRFCLQRGRDERVGSVDSKGGDLSFELEVRAKDVDGAPRFLGPFVQGPSDARFVYVCSGTLAGQPGSCWTRRAKVPLAAITWPLVRQLAARPGARLEARIVGTAGDGGPSCATVPIVGGWRVVD